MRNTLSDEEIDKAIGSIKTLIGEGSHWAEAVIVVADNIEETSGLWSGDTLAFYLFKDPEFIAIRELTK